MTYQRWLLFLAVVIVLLYGSLFVSINHADAVQRICVPAKVDDYIVWINSAEGVVLDKNDKLFASIKALNGPSFWKAKGDYGYFTWPSDHAIEAKFWLWPSRNLIWFESSQSQPNNIYVLWYWDDPIYARADGKYWGIHPCKDFVITRAQADAVYKLAQAD